MPPVVPHRRIASSPAQVVRPSPYPSPTEAIRKVRRGQDSTRAHGRQVLAEIDWWTIMAGQLPCDSRDGSDSDSSSLYTRESLDEDPVERTGFAMDIDGVCLGPSLVPSTSPSSSSLSTSLWSSRSTPERVSSASSGRSTPPPSPSSPSRVTPASSGRPGISPIQQSNVSDGRASSGIGLGIHRSHSFSGFSSPRMVRAQPVSTAQLRRIPRRRL